MESTNQAYCEKCDCQLMIKYVYQLQFEYDMGLSRPLQYRSSTVFTTRAFAEARIDNGKGKVAEICKCDTSEISVEIIQLEVVE